MGWGGNYKPAPGTNYAHNGIPGAQQPAPQAGPPPGAPPAASDSVWSPGHLASAWNDAATRAKGNGQQAASAVGGQDPHAGLQAPQPPQQPQGGSQSGPGILEGWFNQRAGGSDPGWEYATGKATDNINRQFAARGGYNSSGATNAIDDMYANATSQREGQLDTLAAGASGEHRGRLNDMFSQGTNLANGQANTVNGQSGLGAGAISGHGQDQIDLMLQQAGITQKTRQGELNGLGSAINGGVNLGATIYKAAQ